MERQVLKGWADVTEQKAGRIDFDIPFLLVESDPVDLSEFRKVLDDLQFRNVTVARDGYEALQEEESKKYALILVSGATEKVHPLKLIAALRARGANVNTPIVFTYRRREKSFLDEAMGTGATASLRKPFSEQDLRTVIESLLGGYIVSKSDQKRRSEELLGPLIKSVERGKQLLADGSFSGAEEAYEEAVLGLVSGMVEVYLYKGHWEFAEKLLQETDRLEVRAREQLRTKEASYLRRGSDYLKDKSYHQAKEEFRVALMLNGNSLEACVGLGEALLEMGEEEKTTEAFERAMGEEMTAERATAYGRVCVCARRLNRYDLAHRAIDRAIQMEPKIPIHHYYKALVYVAQKNLENALGALNKCIAMNPLFLEARTTKKKVEEWLGAMRKGKLSVGG